MRIGRTTTVYFVTQVTRSLAGFVATLFIARFLGPAVLGQYAVAVALVTWLRIPTIAVGNSITKRVSEGTSPAEDLTAGLSLNGVVILVVAGALLVFHRAVTGYVGATVGPLVVWLYVANVGFRTVNKALIGTKRVGLAGALDAVEQVVRTVLQIGLVLLGLELTGLIVGHAASLALLAVVGSLGLSVRPVLPSREHLVRIASFARYNWLSTFQTRTFGWMDTVVLAFFVQSSLIGIYEVSWRLASVLGLVTISIQQTLFPEISELAVHDDYERVHHFLNEALVYTGVFVIPGLFGVAVIGREVLKIYRPEFQQGAVVLLILVLARMASAYRNPILNAVSAIDRPDVTFRIDLAFIVANLVLNVALVATLGWYGAAIATTLSTLLTMVMGYLALRRLIGTPSLPVAEIGRQFLAGGVMAAVLLVVDGVAPTNHYVTVGEVFLGAAVYSTALVALSARVRHKLIALAASTGIPIDA